MLAEKLLEFREQLSLPDAAYANADRLLRRERIPIFDRGALLDMESTEMWTIPALVWRNALHLAANQ